MFHNIDNIMLKLYRIVIDDKTLSLNIFNVAMLKLNVITYTALESNISLIFLRIFQQNN